MDLQDKTALITGGAVRVGRAMTLALARRGANVIIHYHSSKAEAEATAEQARALGVEALTVQTDLGKPEAVDDLIAWLKATGDVDVLINSASYFLRASLAETSFAQWRHVLAILLDAPFVLAQALAAGMVERGGGLIVNILDRSASEPFPAYLAHGVGKHGLLGLTRNLAVDLAPAVRVNAIAPGPVLAPPGFTEAQRRRVAEGTLLGHWGTPDDVVHALLYLVDADYVTGETLVVDGGEQWK